MASPPSPAILCLPVEDSTIILRPRLTSWRREASQSHIILFTLPVYHFRTDPSCWFSSRVPFVGLCTSREVQLIFCSRGKFMQCVCIFSLHYGDFFLRHCCFPSFVLSFLLSSFLVDFIYECSTFFFL